MHDCGKGCGQACDCDVEDTWLEAPDDCTHECEEFDDEQEASVTEDKRVVRGEWRCEHEDGPATTLKEADALEQSPRYVICPDCGTHWIVWQMGTWKLAKPVIVPMYG